MEYSSIKFWCLLILTFLILRLTKHPLYRYIVFIDLMLHRNKNDRIDLHKNIVKLKYTSIFVFNYVYLYDFIIRYPLIYVEVGMYITNVDFLGDRAP